MNKPTILKVDRRLVAVKVRLHTNDSRIDCRLLEFFSYTHALALNSSKRLPVNESISYRGGSFLWRNIFGADMNDTFCAFLKPLSE